MNGAAEWPQNSTRHALSLSGLHSRQKNSDDGANCGTNHESDSGMSDDGTGPASSLSSPEPPETVSPNPEEKDDGTLKIKEEFLPPPPRRDFEHFPSVIIKTPNCQSSTNDEAPLDFSLKPKKPNLHIDLAGGTKKTDNNLQQPKPRTGKSAFEAVSPHAPGSFAGFSTPPNLAAGPLTGFDPAFLGAAVGGSVPIGSALLTSSFNVQGLTSAFENGSNFSNGVQGRSSSPPPKVTRPFKAYNPTDPSSALQISAQLSGCSPLMTPPQSLSATENFLAQYRQYLLNAQAAILRSRTNIPPNPLPAAVPANAASVIAQALNGGQKAPKSIGSSSQGSLTPSPPQVTSTSHPHFEESAIPPRDSVLLKSSKSIDIGNIIRANQANLRGPERIGHSISADDPKSSANILAALIEKETDSDNSGSSGAAAQRARGKSLPEELKDQAYWERRRKNNEAAKRSRDMRRQKEDEIAMRAAILEQENLRLRLEVQQLKVETEKLRQILLNT